MTRQLTQIAAIKVLEVQIPFSFYVFNTSNNTFYFSEPGSPAVLVTIPVGNYTTTTMSAMLATLLTAASPHARTYVVTFSGLGVGPTTGKFTISNTSMLSTFTLTFGVAGDSQNTNPSIFLGFNSGDNVSNASQVLEAPNVCLITGPNYLYVNSRNQGQLCNLYLPSGARNLGSGNQGPQMAKLPVNCQPGGVIYWSDPNPLMWFDLESMPNLANIDFYLTLGNTSGQTPLKLNGLGFSLKIGFLLNRMTLSNVTAGGAYNDRVYKRIKPR